MVVYCIHTKLIYILIQTICVVRRHKKNSKKNYSFIRHRQPATVGETC